MEGRRKQEGSLTRKTTAFKKPLTYALLSRIVTQGHPQTEREPGEVLLEKHTLLLQQNWNPAIRDEKRIDLE